MDNRLKIRQVGLGPRDSVSSALSAATGAAETSPQLSQDGPLMELKGRGIHELASDNDSNGNSSSASSGLPQGCSVNNLRPMVPGCNFVNDNDSSLQYSDGWSFSTSDPNGLVHTVHFTQTLGSSVSLVFNASDVIVFGVIPSGSSSPQASYSVDGSDPTVSHMAATGQCVPNQQLFNSGNLMTGLHNLTIEVTTASQDQPYILDYLWLCGGGASTGTDRDASDKTATSTDNTSRNTILIVAVLAVLGILLVLSLAGVAYVLVSRIRRKRQLEGQELQADPEKQKGGGVSPEPDSTEDAVPSEPRETRLEVPVNDPFLEEGPGLSELPNDSIENLVSTVDGDRPSSSLGPAPSTSSTVLARRADKMMRFLSPVTYNMKFHSPPPDYRQSIGSTESRTSDGPPPSYTSK